MGREIVSTRKEPPPATCSCKTEHLNSMVEIKNRESISSPEQETVMSRKRSHPSDSDSDIPICKSGRTTWTKDNMVAAITAYKKEKLMGYKQCSEKFGIPMTTLISYIKRSSTKETLSSSLEAEIIQYGMEIKKLFYEVTRIDLCKIASDICKMYNIENKFISQENCSAWLDGFLSRNSFIVQHLSIQKKDSLPCASYESKLVEEFLNTYRTNLDKVNSNPNRIYSCYGIGFAISQQKKKKVILVKGYQQIINLLPNEKSTLITSLICFNANGDFIPPSVICSNQRMESGLKTVLVAGSLLTTHSFGWIPQMVFLQWLEHFINHVKPTANDPVILLINGTESYVKNIEVIKFAKDNNILLTIVPPYQQGSLEPAEKRFVYQFKTLYKQRIETWSELYRKPKLSYVGKFFGLTYLDCATSTIGKCGFAAANLFPLCKQTILLHKSTYSEEKEDFENKDDDCEQNEIKEENKFISCWVNEEVPTEMDGLEHSNNQSDPLHVGIKEEIDAKDEIQTCEETEWDDIKIKGEVLSE